MMMRRFTKLLFGLSLALILVCFGSCQKENEPWNASDPASIFRSIEQEVVRHYSFFTTLPFSWEDTVNHYRAQVTENSNETELLTIIDDLLSSLQDAHTNLYAPSGTYGNTQYFTTQSSQSVDDITHYFSEYQQITRQLQLGQLQETPISYLRIASLAGEVEDYAIADSLLTQINAMQGLIIDLRTNKGGYISNAEILLSSLCSAPQEVMEYRYRNGAQHNDFSEWLSFQVIPYTNHLDAHLPIIVLTSKHTYSAAEWLTLGLKSQNNVRHLGDTTGGGSAIPLNRELPNGWLLRISNSQVKLPSGLDFQWTGITPDSTATLTDEDLHQNIDRLLETSIRMIQQ